MRDRYEKSAKHFQTASRIDSQKGIKRFSGFIDSEIKLKGP